MTLLQAEEKLKSIYEEDYINQDCHPPLKNELKAIEAIEKLTKANSPISATNSIDPTTLLPLPPIAAVDELKVQKCIIETPLTLEGMLNPTEEQEIRDLMYGFEGRDKEIVTTVQCKLRIEARGIIEVDESNDEAEGEREKELTTKQVIELFQQMEALCIEHGSFGDSLGLTKHLWQY